MLAEPCEIVMFRALPRKGLGVVQVNCPKVVAGLIVVVVAVGLVVAMASPRMRVAIGLTTGLRLELEHLFSERAGYLISGDTRPLASHYDLSQFSGRCAYDHEVDRVKLTHVWLQKRGIEVIRLESDLRVISLGSEGGRAWASVCQHLKLSYRHKSDPTAQVSAMGTRTVHWLELVKSGERWLIRTDWFWDPYKDASRMTDVADLGRSAPFPSAPNDQFEGAYDGPGGRFNRAAAARYADAYCGVRAGHGNGRYNPSYRDFAGVGGDCANFASQVLSDPAAGSIPQDWRWFYEGLSGSAAWLRADRLLQYLLNSGRATLLFHGRLPEAAQPTPELPDGPVFAMEPGDLVGYERDGQIEHVSVVVGKDPAGYPVVDSHTGDRYHVPWDLGYDARTRYWLVHITY